MKKWILPFGLMFSALFVYAAGTPVKDVPVKTFGTAVSVSVSTSVWTIGNSTTTLVSERSGFYVNNWFTNSNSIFAVCHTTTPVEAVSVAPWEWRPGTVNFVPCGPGTNIYLRSKHTGAESVVVQEVAR